MKSFILCLSMLIGVSKVQASEVHYQISPQKPAAEMLKLSVPYSFGVHEGQASQLQGTLITDESDQVLRARFQVPIASMSTGNHQRDCHMREALGIDYTHSQFPVEHVCNDENQLPESGPDSVRYPNVTVNFIKMTLPQDPFTIGLPQIADVTIKMNIHGVEKFYKTEKVIITKIVNPNGAPGFRILTKLFVSLNDFGIQVKPLKVGPVSVKVKDLISVAVDIEVMKR